MGHSEGFTILVVEDHADSGEALAMLLEALGHRAEAVFDGTAALAALDAGLPEVMLIDLGLPDMSGTELARRVRALPAGKTLILIALTGHGFEEDRRETLAAGFDYHLVKPVEVEQIADLLRGIRRPGDS